MEELFEKIQRFELKYKDTLIEWLELVKNQKSNHFWRPNDVNDTYAMKLYENSNMHDSALSDFEEQADKNILCTYLKYNSSKSARVIIPFSFNYQEPEIDLVLNPINLVSS